MGKENGAIFSATGQALNSYARKSCRVVTVGNPCNTDCLIAANNAPDIPIENFSAMTRLDHDRSLGQLSKKAKCSVKDIEKFCIWGNHSPTMYPDLSHCTIKGQPAMEALKAANPGEDMDKWYVSELMHARDLELGTGANWTSMAINSTGQYGMTKGLFYSMPVTTENGSY